MAYVRSKLLHLVPVLLLVTLGTFLLTTLMPGDPAQTIAGSSATAEQVEFVREDLGLDQPFLVRYVSWLTDVVRGDLGRSYRTGQPVLDAIVQRLPVSISLMALSQVIAFLIAVPLGIIGAYRARGWFDRASTSFSYGMISVPHFVLAIALVWLVALQLGWLPATGYAALTDGPVTWLRHLLLPALALAGSQVAIYHRLLRGDMLTTLQQDYVLLAKAKGLPTWFILLRHALRPSSFSLVTMAGINIGRLIGGAVIIEIIFALPGIGQLLIQSLYNRDFLMLQGVVLFTAVAYIVINTAVDLLYARLDPRVSHARAA